MRLVLTKRAAQQLEAILAYIAERHPQGALHVHGRVKDVMNLMLDHPLAGAATGHRGGRRIVTTPYPYLIYYRIQGDAVIVQRIRHAARKPLGSGQPRSA